MQITHCELFGMQTNLLQTLPTTPLRIGLVSTACKPYAMHTLDNKECITSCLCLFLTYFIQYYVIWLKVRRLNVSAESQLLASLHLTQLPSLQLAVTLQVLTFQPTYVTIMCWLSDIWPNDAVSFYTWPIMQYNSLLLTSSKVLAKNSAECFEVGAYFHFTIV